MTVSFVVHLYEALTLLTKLLGEFRKLLSLLSMNMIHNKEVAEKWLRKEGFHGLFAILMLHVSYNLKIVRKMLIFGIFELVAKY